VYAVARTPVRGSQARRPPQRPARPDVAAAWTGRRQPAARAAEIKAIYPNRQAVPPGGVAVAVRLRCPGDGRPGLLRAVPRQRARRAERARAPRPGRVRVRICCATRTNRPPRRGAPQKVPVMPRQPVSARHSPCSGSYARPLARRSGCTGPSFTTPSTGPTTRSWSASTLRHHRRAHTCPLPAAGRLRWPGHHLPRCVRSHLGRCAVAGV